MRHYLISRLLMGPLLALAQLSAVAATPALTPLKRWCEQPAANWDEALLIGNGRLGALVFGGLGQERLQLNEAAIWAGGRAA